MRTKICRVLLFVSLPAIVLTGCEAMKSSAPAINPAMTQVAVANGDSPEMLAEGRRLLAMRCTSCHALEPVPKYTSGEWRANVRRMANRAGLDPTEERQIVAYLVAARESM